jgi:hypothetical protein
MTGKFLLHYRPTACASAAWPDFFQPAFYRKQRNAVLTILRRALPRRLLALVGRTFFLSPTRLFSSHTWRARLLSPTINANITKYFGLLSICEDMYLLPLSNNLCWYATVTSNLSVCPTHGAKLLGRLAPSPLAGSKPKNV